MPESVSGLHQRIIEAVEALRLALRSEANPEATLQEVAAGYDVSPDVLRTRFAAAIGDSIEEFHSKFQHRFTLDEAIYEETQNRPLSALDHKLMGKRFNLIPASDPNRPFGWYRFISFTGRTILSISEETLRIGEIWDWDLIDEVGEQIGHKFRI